jgi:hypothetical protein
MPAFQHLLETRFSALPGFTPEWLEERVELFRRLCLPSVASQSTDSFTWLLFCDESTDERTLEQLRREEHRLPNLQVTLTSAERTRISIVREHARTGADVLITTRLDSDDAIADTYLEAVQDYAESFRRSRHERLLVNFPRGYRLHVPHDRLYGDWMPNSPFHSLFERPRHSTPRGVMSAGHAELHRHYAALHRRLPMLDEKGAGWHARLHQHYATHQDESMHAWLIAIHGGNQVSRVPNTAVQLPEGARPTGITLGAYEALR